MQPRRNHKGNKMSRQYTEISQEEMHDFLTELGFTKYIPNNTLDNRLEVSYVRWFGLNRIIVWTSLNFRGKQAGKGADAIRIVIHLAKAGRYLTTPHTKRMTTWKEILWNKIHAAMDTPGLWDSKLTCAYCGDPAINGLTSDGQPVCAYHEEPLIDSEDYFTVLHKGTSVYVSTPVKFGMSWDGIVISE